MRIKLIEELRRHIEMRIRILSLDTGFPAIAIKHEARVWELKLVLVVLDDLEKSN